jgi:hypothetical protein
MENTNIIPGDLMWLKRTPESEKILKSCDVGALNHPCVVLAVGKNSKGEESMVENIQVAHVSLFSLHFIPFSECFLWNKTPASILDP